MLTRTFTKPVYPYSFADPFVWQYQGEYYAVGTGPFEASGHTQQGAPAGEGQPTIFPVLHSIDFVHWRSLGYALIRPEISLELNVAGDREAMHLTTALGDTFWAPEVAYGDGNFIFIIP